LWEHKLRVFKNRVLRRIFKPKDKVNGSGEDYITREPCDLYTSPNILQGIKSRMKQAGHVACKGDRRYSVLMGQTERN